MTDKIEIIAGSVVQHGYHNHRIYVMHLDTQQTDHLIPILDRLAQKKGYGKIFAKIPATHWRKFKAAGYTREAVVPGFFKGVTDGLFIARFLSEKRGQTEGEVWQPPRETDHISRPKTKDSTPSVIACGPQDAVVLADLYCRVFETYAFPIDQADYLKRMMQENLFYFSISQKQTLIAAAALEIDFENGNCEMTDFATLPQFRGRGLAGGLLRRLDQKAISDGLKIAYTIARADSAAMNVVFYKSGYRYAGRLINNTQIGGRIRNMNVWYKRLKPVTHTFSSALSD